MAKNKDTGLEAGSAATAVRRPRKPKLTRVEKSHRTRQAICDAAAEVIGQYGYAEASISRIMEHAGFGLDCRILWRTFRQVFQREGISAEGHATMPKFRGSGQQENTK